MISTTIFPGRYVQGKDARKVLGSELSRYGDRGFVICDPYVHSDLLAEFEPYMREKVRVVIEKLSGECSDEEIERLLNLIKKSEHCFIAGLGGWQDYRYSKSCGT